MAFKYVLETLDGLSDSVKAEYSKVDGKFYLQVEGMVPQERLDEQKTKVDEFRTNNTKFMKENDELKKVVDSYGDISPDDAKKYKEQNTSGFKFDPENSDVKTHVNGLVENRTEKMREDFDKKILESEQAGKKSAARLSKLLVDDALKSAAIESKVKNEALQDVILRGGQRFKVVDGVVVAQDDKGDTIFGKDGKTPQTINEWLGERNEDSPHWFETSKGGGGRQSDNVNQSSGAANKGDAPRGINRMREARASN